MHGMPPMRSPTSASSSAVARGPKLQVLGAALQAELGN